MRQEHKQIFFRIFSILAGVMMLAIVAEIVLRFLPVTQGFNSMPVNEQAPIFRCEPNRTVKCSAFWNFSMTTVIKINNYGFISDLDYDPGSDTPHLAIVGDSFVEAIAVPWPQTAAAKLHERLSGRARAYAFGKSGAPLSQYLKYAEYAKQTFGLDGLAVFVVGNDFDESLLQYGRMSGFHYFVENRAGRLALRRVDLEIGWLKKLLRQSAFCTYLLINVRLPDFYREWKYRWAKTKFVGNTAASADSIRLADSRRAVEAFLAMLPAMSGLAPSKILFVVDGMRPQLYDGAALQSAQGSYFDLMRRYFMENANAQGFEVIDMQPIFIQHYKKHGKKFDYPKDNHWNSLGQKLVAEAVAGSEVFRKLPAPEPNYAN